MLLRRRGLLQSTPLNITTNTVTSSPSTAATNIRNAISNGSLQAQLTPLGLSIVPGSLGTSTVSVHIAELGPELHGVPLAAYASHTFSVLSHMHPQQPAGGNMS
jgi:hypothetical protein